MNDELIERLARANPVPSEMPPLPFEAIRRRRDEHRTQPVAPTWRSRLLGAALADRAVIAVVLAITCVVAIASVVLLARPDGAGPLPPAPPAARALGSISGLKQALEVLRRPQTAVDRKAERLPSRGGSIPGMLRVGFAPGFCRGARGRPPCTYRLAKRLVRQVSVGDGYTASIFPIRLTHASTTGQRGAGVLLSLRGPGVYIDSTPQPTGVQSIRSHGVLLLTIARAGTDRGVLLVPDKVNTVSLTDLRILAPTGATTKTVSVSISKVEHNFALVTVHDLTAKALALNPHALRRFFIGGMGHGCQPIYADYALPTTARMAWQNASGQTTRRVTIDLRLDIRIHNPPGAAIVHGPACSQ